MTIVKPIRTAFVVWCVAAALVAVGCSKDPNVAKQEHFERGEQYFEQGKYPEAIIEYRNAVQLDAQFGRARYKLSEAYSRTGDLRNAFAEMVRASDLLPDADVQVKAGNFLLLARRYDDARARAEGVLTREPGNTQALVLKANALAGSNDLDAAITEMERAIAADPTNGLTYASLGAFELLRGNRAEAEAAYTRAVESDPTSAQAQLALGNYRLAVNDRAAAEQAFLRASALEPKNVLALRALTGLYISERAFAKAEPLLQRTAAETKDPQTRLLLADVYVAMEEPNRARSVLESLVPEKEAFVPAKLRLATLDYTTGRKAEGLAHVDDVLKQQPKQAQALVLKGRILASERKWDQAIAELRAAVAADPKGDAPQYWLGATLASRGRVDEARKALSSAIQANPRAVSAQILLSQLQLRAGERDAALEVAQQAVQNAPGNPDARVALVWALIGKRNLARAQDELKPLASAQPAASDVLVLQGTLDMMRNNPKAAEQSFARALDVQPKSYEALAGMIQTRIAGGNLAGAQAQVEAAVQQAPEDAVTLVLAARTYATARDFDKAEQALRRALAADPQQLDAYALLGQIYIAQRRADAAIKEFDELSKRQSNPVAAHTVVGMLLQASDKRPEAKARYEQALNIDPTAAVAANNLAWMQVEDGDNLDVALRLAQTAKGRLPDSPEVSDTLGYIYYLKGLYPSAIDAFKVGVEKQPRNAMYQFRLGMAYAKNGQTLQARQTLDRALRLDPDFSGANEARETLATLPL